MVLRHRKGPLRTAPAETVGTPVASRGDPPAPRAGRQWRNPGLPGTPRAVHAGASLLLAAGVAAVVASALIHLHLWLGGYRQIALIGPAFLAQSATGLLLAAGLLTYRRLPVVLAGALYLVGSVVAFGLSATVGLLGFHDGLAAPWAGWALGVELAGGAALAATAVVMARAG